MSFASDRKNWIVLILGLVAAGGVLYASYTKVNTRGGLSKSTTPTPQDTAYRPKADEPGTPTTVITPLPISSSPTPTPAPPQSSASGLVTILSPSNGATVTSGTKVTGQAKVVDGKLHWRVKAVSSGQLGEGIFALTGDPTITQNFSFELAFTSQAKAGDSGELQVFSISPTDSSEINVADVAVNF